MSEPIDALTILFDRIMIELVQYAWLYTETEAEADRALAWYREKHGYREVWRGPGSALLGHEQKRKILLVRRRPVADSERGDKIAMDGRYKLNPNPPKRWPQDLLEDENA